MHSTDLQCTYNAQMCSARLSCAAEQDVEKKKRSMNSATLHSALEQEAKKNAFITAMEDEVCRAGCYRLDWILARASANTFVQTAVGFFFKRSKIQTFSFVYISKQKQ